MEMDKRIGGCKGHAFSERLVACDFSKGLACVKGNTFYLRMKFTRNLLFFGLLFSILACKSLDGIHYSYS